MPGSPYRCRQDGCRAPLGRIVRGQLRISSSAVAVRATLARSEALIQCPHCGAWRVYHGRLTHDGHPEIRVSLDLDHQWGKLIARETGEQRRIHGQTIAIPAVVIAPVTVVEAAAADPDAA